MKSETEERTWLAGEIAKRASMRERLPDNVRRAAIAYAARCVARGDSRGTIASELGVTTMSVKRWIAMSRTTTSSSRATSTPPVVSRPKASTPKLKRVLVVKAPQSGGGSIVVTTRDGLRIEGLAVADIVTLLRATT